MTITWKQILTKPADKQFYSQVSPENNAETVAYKQWIAAQPGFISQTTQKPDDNTRLTTVVFDTIENYANWNSARLNRSDVADFRAYNSLNGITFSNQEIIS